MLSTLLSAVKAGVFVEQEVGDGGHFPKTLWSYCPWIASVAAAIDDRRYKNHLSLENGKSCWDGVVIRCSEASNSCRDSLISTCSIWILRKKQKLWYTIWYIWCDFVGRAQKPLSICNFNLQLRFKSQGIWKQTLIPQLVQLSNGYSRSNCKGRELDTWGSFWGWSRGL